MIDLQDLIDRFGEQEIAELTDRDAGDVVNTDVVARAISDATAEVESYLQPTGLVSRSGDGVLTLSPLVKQPKVLMLRTCDIARYYLYDDGVTDIVDKRYKQAVDWLKQVMRQPAMLTGKTADGGTSGSSNTGAVVMPNPKPSTWVD